MGPIRIQLDGSKVLTAVLTLKAHIEEELHEDLEEAVIGGILFEILATEAASLVEQAAEEPHYLYTRPDFQRLWRKAVMERK